MKYFFFIINWNIFILCSVGLESKTWNEMEQCITEGAIPLYTGTIMCYIIDTWVLFS